MKKRSLIMLLVLLFMLSFTSMVAAHSHVKSTVPGDGETVEEPVETIEIVFDAGIEQATTIKIVDEEGNEVSLAEEKVDSPTYTAILEQPLESGTYVVEWTAFGEDGHTTEGTFTFSVAASVETEVDEATEELVEGESIGEENEPAEEPQPQEEELPEEPEENKSNAVIWIVIIGVALLAVILFFLLRK